MLPKVHLREEIHHEKEIKPAPNVLTVLNSTDKHHIQRILDREKHTRQKPAYQTGSLVPNLPLHLIV